MLVTKDEPNLERNSLNLDLADPDRSPCRPRNRIYTVINTAIRIDQSSSYPTNLVLERAREFAKAKDGSWEALQDVVYFSMLKFKRNYRVRQQLCNEFELGDSGRLLLEEG